MSSNQQSVEFFAALSGKHTSINRPPAIGRESLTAKRVNIRLALGRDSASAQYGSALLVGDELHFSASAWTKDTHKRIAVPDGEIEAQIEELLGAQAIRHLLTHGDIVAEGSGKVWTAHRQLIADPAGNFYTPSPLQMSAIRRAFGKSDTEPLGPMGIASGLIY
ncbi:hypothetical protein G7068_12115 [Leucobacter viscericola]|uniref:Uncharacterized protein n=1 Tax=Leucobacter viscericola TaxID=2714935 RepID=A0A6G7XGX2_9MICO|nr:hypothetical protein [Leucobacter viscericola]QIK63854.1 hypothetical protein G7068_12115 [Leucobacter viscericola]